MSKVVLGFNGVKEQPKKYSGGPFKPDQVVRSWSGPKDKILAMIPSIKAMGFDWSIEEKGATATVEVNTIGATLITGGDPAAEVPIDTWELLPGAVEKDVLESDLAVVNAMTDADKQLMRRIMNNETIATVQFSSAAQSAGVAQLASAIMEGLRVARVFAPVLTRTRSVSSAYTVDEAETYVQRVWSTASLVGSEALPSSFLISLNKAPYTNSNPSIYKSYGWYKHPPTQRAAAMARTVLEQKWEFGLYANIVYGAAV